VDLRDSIAPGEKVAWWVVVCGDTERFVPATLPLGDGAALWANAGGKETRAEGAQQPTVKKRSPFAKLFGSRKQDHVVRRSQSTKALGGGPRSAPSTSAGNAPPLPTVAIPQVPSTTKAPDHSRIPSSGSANAVTR